MKPLNPKFELTQRSAGQLSLLPHYMLLFLRPLEKRKLPIAGIKHDDRFKQAGANLCEVTGCGGSGTECLVEAYQLVRRND